VAAREDGEYFLDSYVQNHFLGISASKEEVGGRSSLERQYYAASVGDKVTAEMVKKYISHQRQTSFDW
jgi:REP element-mobilizing transposase RayT